MGREFSCLVLLGLIIFGPLLATLSPLAAFALPAEIELLPAEGEAGSTVTIVGSGFTPLTEIEVEFGGESLSTVAADEVGEFAADFEVPYFTPAGTVSVIAVDGSANGTEALSEFTIVNSPPVADSQPPVTVEENGSALINMTASDANGDTLSMELVDLPSHGALSDFDPDAGEVIYTPDPGYSGEDSFSFKVSDGDSDSNISEITLAVVSADAPEVSDIAVSTQEDEQVTVVLELSDQDSPSVEFVLFSEPANGTLGSLDGTGPYTAEVSYTPNPNFSGHDSFAFGAYDEESDLTVGTVSVTVEPVNDPPAAQDKSVDVKENSRKKVTLEASDPDNDPLTYTIVSSPDHGVLTGTSPALFYDPDEDYTGDDSFKFVASDSVADSNIAIVSITVDPKGGNDEYDYYEDDSQDQSGKSPVGSAPVSQSSTVSGPEDVPLEIALAAKDPDGDPLTFSIIDFPQHGTVSQFDESSGKLTYTPDLEFSGADALTFVAADEYKKSKKATVTILIEPVNDPPRPVSMNVTAADGAANITLAAFDPEGDQLQFAIYSEPANGLLSGNGSDLFYAADQGYSGYDKFLFTVTDGRPDSRIGVISIFVGEPAAGVSEPDEDDLPGSSGEPDTEPAPPAQNDDEEEPGRNDDSAGEQKSTTKARADKSKVMVMLSWEHQSKQEGIDSTLHLSFAEHRTREPLGSHIWYDLVVLDDLNNEILRKNDLVAENSEDVQNLTFPANGTYHVEVNVKGLIDKSTNAITRNTDYTGKALGTVVVPEFISAWALAAVAAVMASAIVVARCRGGFRPQPF